MFMNDKKRSKNTIGFFPYSICITFKIAFVIFKRKLSSLSKMKIFKVVILLACFIFAYSYNSTPFNSSEPGSTSDYTSVTRNIIYSVVKKYELKSILDVPCGSLV